MDPSNQKKPSDGCQPACNKIADNWGLIIIRNIILYYMLFLDSREVFKSLFLFILGVMFRG